MAGGGSGGRLRMRMRKDRVLSLMRFQFPKILGKIFMLVSEALKLD